MEAGEDDDDEERVNNDLLGPCKSVLVSRYLLSPRMSHGAIAMAKLAAGTHAPYSN